MVCERNDDDDVEFDDSRTIGARLSVHVCACVCLCVMCAYVNGLWLFFIIFVIPFLFKLRFGLLIDTRVPNEMNKKIWRIFSIINSRVDETMMCVCACVWMGIRMIACERGGEIFTQFLLWMEYMVMSCRVRKVWWWLFTLYFLRWFFSSRTPHSCTMICSWGAVCVCVCVRETADMCSVLCIACTFHYGIETETSTREQIQFFGYCCVPSTVLSSSRNGWRVSRLVERTQPFIHSNV